MNELRITDVEVYLIDLEQNYVIVRILTNDKQLFGLGDATLNGREPAVAAYIKDAFIPLMIGKDVRNHNAIWELLYKAAYWLPGCVAMSALSGIDMALWDIRGKIAEQPVWQMLGGKFRDAIEVYTHISASTESSIANLAQQKIEEGFTAIRVQPALNDQNTGQTYGTTNILPVGFPLVETWDVDAYLTRIPMILKKVRTTVGPSIKLIHDSHERLSIADAIRFARNIEDVDLYFWEDPFRPETALGNLRRLRSGYSTSPIAYGELLNRFDQVIPFLHERLIDHLRLDVSHIGGITGAMRMAHLSQMFDIKTSWHGPPDLSPIGHIANLHMDMAVQNFGIQEWAPMQNAKTIDLFGRLPVPRQGNVMLYDINTPGLGCVFNSERAADYPYKPRFLPIAQTKDGTIIDW
jgi:mannonate dehydratase